MLTIKNLTVKTRNKKPILSRISLTFRPKKIYAIMGPNGSGKSTLARTIMGDTAFIVAREAEMTLNRTRIKTLSPDKRARKGVFLSLQSPLAIPGVTVFGLLRAATQHRNLRATELQKIIAQYAKELAIPNELLARPLNEGFSGGERKKMEVLQMAILDPTYIFLDEIDTGVDVDALKTIAQFLKKFIKNTDKTLVIITHYNRILKYLTPDETIVIKNGKIKKRGNATLAKDIEQHGFAHI